MGISHNSFGNFKPEIQIEGRLTLEELKAIESGVGIEVDLGDLTFLQDGTLALKDRRVLLYIRDVHNLRNKSIEDSFPKYHFYNCSALQRMQSMNRFHSKYKVAAEMTGVFEMNVFTDNRPNNQKVPLRVCICCLKELPFPDFDTLSGQPRKDYIAEFKPRHFFECFPKRHNFAIIPKKSEMTSPLNAYPANWEQISKGVKDRAGWRCMNPSCNRLLDGIYRKYLHVHHKNGDRSDISIGNLISLCIDCHCKEPMHSHLRSSPDYNKYKVLVFTKEI
jgi:hypothetical protein